MVILIAGDDGDNEFIKKEHEKKIIILVQQWMVDYTWTWLV